MSLPVSGVAPYATDVHAGVFIPEIWSGKLQAKFYEASVVPAIANTDWEGEIRDQGDKVIIRTVPTINVSQYKKGLTLAKQVPQGGKVELLIDRGWYFNVIADDVDQIQSDIAQMEVFSNDASEQMKIKVDTNVLASMASWAPAADADDGAQLFSIGKAADTNRGLTAGAKSGDISLGNGSAAVAGDAVARKLDKTNVLDFIVDMGLVMDEANLPENGRKLVIPAWMGAMIKKSDLKDASLAGDGTSILRNGRLGMIDRFELFVSNLLPSRSGVKDDGGGTDKRGHAVFALTRDALTFASQVTKVETLRSESTFGDIMRGLNVYGARVVTPQALVEGFVTK